MVLTLAQYGTIERGATASVPGVRVGREPKDVVWYGGMLDPVVVEAIRNSKGSERQFAMLSGRTLGLGVAHPSSGPNVHGLCESGHPNPSIER